MKTSEKAMNEQIKEKKKRNTVLCNNKGTCTNEGRNLIASKGQMSMFGDLSRV